MNSKDLQFSPDYTPSQLREMGVYGEVYGPKTAPRLASLPQWPEHWYNEADPHGWLQWYNRYSKGRRIEDDQRQIKRWLAFKARHGGKMFQENPTPRRAYALRNWAVDPLKLVKDPKKRVELQKAMEEYRAKKYKTAEVIDYIELYKKASERPGLWENIRKKRARGEKPAKPGEKGYPDRKQWKRLTSKKAELLKSAMTLGATKALLKALNAQGTKIYRNIDDLVKAHIGTTNKALKPTKNNLVSATPTASKEDIAQFKNVLLSNGPGYMPAINAIYSPRGNFNFINGSISPRQSLFHEGGHAMHYMEDPKLLSLVVKRLMAGKGLTKNTIAAERIANNNAINFMREQKVPVKHIDTYAKNSNIGYGSYLQHYKNLNPTSNSIPKNPFSVEY